MKLPIRYFFVLKSQNIVSEALKLNVFANVIIGLAIFPGIAQSQVIDCGQVLSEKVINTRSMELSERIIAGMKSDICNRTFDSKGQVTEKLRSGGWGLELFDIFDNSLVDTKQSSEGSYSVQRTRFCSQSTADLSRSLGSNYQERNGRFALQAFEACVQRTSASLAYLEYNLVGVGADQIVEAQIHRRVGGTQTNLSFDIQGISHLPETAGVSCKIASQPIPEGLSPEQPIKATSTPIAVSCARQTDVNTTTTVQTSLGSFTIVSPSKAEDARLREFEALSSELAVSQKKAVQLQDSLSDERKQVGDLSQRVSQLEQDKVVLARRHNAQLFTVYNGDNPGGIVHDIHAPCGTNWGTPDYRGYGQAQCRARNLELWAIRVVSSFSGGQCGHTSFALLCQGR
ncbi:MAG: hypothetical protein R8G34_11190 [Paracoccaceae bacterium]|nr:hypothetical protein [Paracoccaceae bacterium]